MSILKNPNEINEDVKLAGLIYGQPGVGKTTLLLSSPNPVLIDADQGLRRVEKRFQVPSLPLNSYKDFIALLTGDELNPFDSIVVDTLGKFIDRMGDWIMENNPKMRQADGSLTLKAYGSIRVEFQRVLRQVKDKNKFLFFGAHEREERDGDTRFVRPDVAGSAGKDLVKDLDFMGYMEMRGGKRTISFSPSDKYYAKNSLQLEEIIEVPNTDKGNTFLKDRIIDRAIERLKSDDVQNQKYVEQVEAGKKLIAQAKTADECLQALAVINGAQPIWDSARQLKKALSDRATALNLAYDKAEKKFKDKVAAPAAPPADPVATPKPEPEVAAANKKTKPVTPAAQAEHSDKLAKSSLELIAEAMVNGIADCKTQKELTAYLKTQQSDMVEIGSKAALGTQLMVSDAITAKQQQLIDDVHKAA